MRIALLLLALIAPLPVAADSPPDAAGLAEAMRGRVWHDTAPLGDASFGMTCVIEDLDAHGAVTSRLVLEHRRTFIAGSMREELLAVHENGIDVLERQRKVERGAKRGSPLRRSVDDALAPPIPFLVAPPSAYELALAPLPGRALQRLTYSPIDGAAPGRRASGYLDIDPGDGLPVLLVSTPIPFPKLIRSLVTTVRYGRLDGVAIPESTESLVEGGFLFFKRRLRIRMNYHDWALRPAAEPWLRTAEPRGK